MLAQRRCVAVQPKITHHNIPLPRCHVYRTKPCGPVSTGLRRGERIVRSASSAVTTSPGPGKRARTVLGRARSGRVGLHLARAVVPPPRLRAKSVSISAPLHPSSGSACWASPERTGVEKTLQNPARTPCFPNSRERDPEALFSGDPWETSNLGMSR